MLPVCPLQLRKLRTAAQRTEVCNRLVRDLHSASAYPLRIDFLHACGLLLNPHLPCGCSHACFKAHGLHHSLLALASDPVANVRLHLCALLPPLKRTLRLPGDNDALQNLHHAVVALQSDAARDVRRAAGVAEGLLRQFDMLTEGSGRSRRLSRVDMGGTADGASSWACENEERLSEEEAMARAEQESVADAKRRAADELAERARAAYASKMAEGDGARRSHRSSRELPTHLTRTAITAAAGERGSGSSSTSPSSSSPLLGGRKEAPWNGGGAARTQPTSLMSSRRKSAEGALAAVVEAQFGSAGGRVRRPSREEPPSGGTTLPPLPHPRSRRPTH